MTGTHQYLNGPKWKSSIWAPMICQYYVGKGEVQARFLTVTNSMKKSVVWDKNTKFEVRFLVAKFNAYLYMDIDIWKCLSWKEDIDKAVQPEIYRYNASLSKN